MTRQPESGPDVVQTVVNNFGALFRHLFPGVLVLGVARIICPCWFGWIDTHSWPNLAFTGVIALTVGNVCFAVNRYITFQVCDFLLYQARPAKSQVGYHQYLTRHVTDALYVPDGSKLADQHVKFRYASVQFLYLIAEVGVILCWFGPLPRWSLVIPILIFLGAGWQHYITREIDGSVVAENKKRQAA
jgi:hypothetical protein